MINWEIKNKIPWLDEVPKHWDIVRIKHLFSISKEKNEGQALDVLSLTQRGIVLRDISNNEGQIASSYENYTRVRPGDFVFNPMDLVTGYVDCSKYDGVISLAYTTLRPLNNKKISSEFYTYYFQWHYLQEILFPFGQGVSPEHRWTLKDRILLNFPIVFPPYEEQVKIANTLKQKMSMIEDLAKILPKEIIRECISSIIYSAITTKN
ncbi:MAG: restriction endonuclease subunit S [Candidatus Pacebacteria bacterium]|nr:restriction endonuclease subunit S [Candidatus Paceibacterota bacterium]MBP9770269.1 restriction endonuclease subunit S [Candidatus Paceibacterota bacterium]